VKGVRETIEFSGAEVHYLPSCSPDLNPIELVFLKLKKLLRGGTEQTVDALWNQCGRILDQFSNEECRNYFKHCGYRYDEIPSVL
jgi:transposase